MDKMFQCRLMKISFSGSSGEETVVEKTTVENRGSVPSPVYKCIGLIMFKVLPPATFGTGWQDKRVKCSALHLTST